MVEGEKLRKKWWAKSGKKMVEGQNRKKQNGIGKKMVVKSRGKIENKNMVINEKME